MKSSKILIVEDEVLIAEHIKDYLTDFGFTQIFLAHSKKMAIEAIELINPDLVLLDLHMSQPKEGLVIAQLLDEKTKSTPYIFITANVDVLVIQQAVQTNACGYITKPLKKADLFAAIQLAIKTKVAPENTFILIKENNENIKIQLDDILYIESNSNYIHIFTKQQKIIARQSLEWIELKLPEHRFKRIHRSYVVNLMAVQKINTRFVYIDNKEIPISRTNAVKINEFVKLAEKNN